MKQPTLNQVAIWSPIPSSELHTKQYLNNRTFVEANSPIVHVASYSRPVYEYAMNFKKKDLQYSLFIYSDESIPEKVVEFLKKVNRGIRKDKVLKALAMSSTTNFEYIDKHYEKESN